MKKMGVWVILALLVFSLVPSVLSEDNESTNTSITTTTGEEIDEDEKIENGFDCLEKEVDDCSDLTIQEIALTIMATPKDSVFESCVDELESRKASNNWGNVRDTALAIIALDHAGENTESAEEWLIKQARTPTELEWYLQEDSEGETECNIQYQTNDYSILIGENKKIDKNAGACLTKAQSSFWLGVSSSCYDEEFKISCNKDFIATLLYKNRNSPIIYVLEGTERATGLSGIITLKVNSKCFGDSTYCNYEATAWSTLALLEKGYDVEEYIPYIIAMAETNKRYIPNTFIYPITGYEDYANRLIQEQTTGFYWLAENSAYNKIYDTSLAILSLTGSSSEQVSKSKDWLLFSQGTNGCWQNSVKDTAMALWALAGRTGKNGGSSVTYCSEANYFCTSENECSEGDKLSNYFCGGSGKICCKNENFLTCSEYGGQICESGLSCTGNERKSSDETYCCVGDCIEMGNQLSECEDMYYSCMDSCSSNQEPVEYSCEGKGTCCRTKTAPAGGSLWWIWLLIILILIVLAVFGWIYREKLKLYWFQLKTKFKKDKDKGKRGGTQIKPRPGMPPRPGFPPIRRPMIRAPNSKRSYDRRDKAMSDTFKKLRDMTK